MKDDEALDSTRAEPLYSSKPAVPAYVAYHIRRGDFQQKFTRLPAEEIVRLTEHLVPDRANRLLYIATDECNRSFFEPFVRAFKKVVYLSDYEARTNISSLNRNYVGMIEQVVCANAYTFIGTPLSTFTAYITRMRGFLNRTITPEYNNYYSKMQQQMDLHDLKVGATEKRLSTYAGSSAVRINRAGLYNRTFYFMKNHMYHLHLKPRFNFPLWVRDYVDPFVAIDDFTA